MNDRENNEQSTIKENPKEEDELCVWTLYDEKIAKTKPDVKYHSRTIIEVQLYLGDEVLGRNKNPLDWCDEHSYNILT